MDLDDQEFQAPSATLSVQTEGMVAAIERRAHRGPEGERLSPLGLVGTDEDDAQKRFGLWTSARCPSWRSASPSHKRWWSG
jgi:hypothetical protein